MSKALSRTVVVSNPQGLHARPADLLVRLANQFTAEILIGRGGEMVDCKSILSLLTLGAAEGTELYLSASGDDAENAVDAIEQFFLRGFDEHRGAQAETSPNEANVAIETDPTSPG